MNVQKQNVDVHENNTIIFLYKFDERANLIIFYWCFAIVWILLLGAGLLMDLPESMDTKGVLILFIAQATISCVLLPAMIENMINSKLKQKSDDRK